MPCDNHGDKCLDAKCTNNNKKNIDNGLMTRVWGSSGWLFTHCITFGFPFKIDTNNKEHLEKQNDYYKFFYYLGKVLPCKYCRDSYMNFFAENSPLKHLGSRKELTKWLYNIHNLVNNKLGVPQCEQPSFNEIEERYESFRAACSPLTDKERINNSIKGCIAPADGKAKQSVIKVIEYDKINNQNIHVNVKQVFPKSDDYFVINKKIIYIVITIIISILLFFLVKQFTKKK